MHTELGFILLQLQAAYSGDPWFGRSVKALLHDVDEATALAKPNGGHSILQLVWHMVNWRAFAINSLKPVNPVTFYDANDWQALDHTDKSLWPQGLMQLDETQDELIDLLREIDDSALATGVPGRKYDFRYLLHGLIQHDIYHAGQIAYITKTLRNRNGTSE